MTPLEQEYVARLEARLQALEQRRRSPARSAIVAGVPLAALALLTAATPSTGVGAIEARLAALESIVSITPDGVAQARGPFQVTDGSGKVIFAVGDRAVSGAVNVTKSATSAALRLIGSTGKDAVNLVVDAAGAGRISNFDANGEMVAQFNPAGLNVYLAGDDSPIAGVTRGEGYGRVAVFNANTKAIELTSTANGSGRLNVRDEAGKVRVSVRPDDGVAVFDANEKNVALMTSRNGRGAVAVASGSAAGLAAEMIADSLGGGTFHMKGSDNKVAIGLYGRTRTIAVGNSAGKTVAEISVHPSGSGLFQVWGDGKLPLALLGRSVEGTGGIMQVSNGSAVILSLTGSSAKNGYIQLNNSAGEPRVEAGVQENGLGAVRAGPKFECIHRPTGIIDRLPDCIRGKP